MQLVCAFPFIHCTRSYRYSTPRAVNSPPIRTDKAFIVVCECLTPGSIGRIYWLEQLTGHCVSSGSLPTRQAWGEDWWKWSYLSREGSQKKRRRQESRTGQPQRKIKCILSWKWPLTSAGVVPPSGRGVWTVTVLPFIGVAPGWERALLFTSHVSPHEAASVTRGKSSRESVGASY